MKYLLIYLLLICANAIHAQKKIIDYANSDIWESVDQSPNISNDGKYVAYYINGKRPRMIIQSKTGDWRTEVFGAYESVITENSKFVIMKLDDESLCILTLGTSKKECLTNISSFKVCTHGNGEWIGYTLNVKDQQLVLYNLNTENRRIYNSIYDYHFSDDGYSLLLQVGHIGDNSTMHSLVLVNLLDGNEKEIWKGTKADGITFGKNGNQLAFIDKDNIKDESYRLWYYNESFDSAVLYVDNQTKGMENDVILNGGQPRFNTDGNKIFFSVMQTYPFKDKNVRGLKEMNIWKHTDDVIPSSNIQEPEHPIYEAVINVDYDNLRVIQLTKKNEYKKGIRVKKARENFIVVGNHTGNMLERNWRQTAREKLYLVSTEDGSRVLLKDNSFLDATQISPSEKYVIYYDCEKKNFYSYNIKTKNLLNITENIPVALYDDEWDRPEFPRSIGIAAWLPNDTALLIYDRYDIWQVDPRGIDKPINITNGFGREHNIVFRLTYVKDVNKDMPTVEFGEELLLMAFNRVNKYNGFYSVKLGVSNSQKKLTMGPYIYHLPYIQSSLLNLSSFPVKARNTDLYIVKRMSSTEAPNLYFTKDFIKYMPLTNICPQSEFNWLTTELVKWKMLDGKYAEGILYKPENFDSTKKYPIIFYFYEKLSDGINEFKYPELSPGTLNIPAYVSNGYMVFVPNIYYKVGEPGESVINSVVSAAKHFSSKHWIDSTKMGIQGHSFGGYEVNYLVTHTSIFAAAVSASGTSDLVSTYGFDKFNCEQGCFRLNATLWERPDLYIKNSPLFSAPMLSTPLLLEIGQMDKSVPCEQGMEFFTALRRLGKNVLMLQYIDQGHGLSDSASLDYTIRMAQFFNYYLKNDHRAEWIANKQ